MELLTSAILTTALIASPLSVQAEAALSTYKAVIERYATQYGVSYERMLKTIECESQFDPEAHNPEDPGGSYGIAQFSTSTFAKYAPLAGIVEPDINNSDHQIQTMAYMFSKGLQSRWTCYIQLFDPPINDSSMYCSCVKTARYFGVPLPRGDAKDLKPNSTPKVGGAVLFNYPKGGEHVAVITGLNERGMTIVEGNYRKCLKTTRFIPWTSPYITGFWHVEDT